MTILVQLNNFGVDKDGEVIELVNAEAEIRSSGERI